MNMTVSVKIEEISTYVDNMNQIANPKPKCTQQQKAGNRTSWLDNNSRCPTTRLDNNSRYPTSQLDNNSIRPYFPSLKYEKKEFKTRAMEIPKTLERKPYYNLNCAVNNKTAMYEKVQVFIQITTVIVTMGNYRHYLRNNKIHRICNKWFVWTVTNSS